MTLKKVSGRLVDPRFIKVFNDSGETNSRVRNSSHSWRNKVTYEDLDASESFPILGTLLGPEGIANPSLLVLGAMTVMGFIL